MFSNNKITIVAVTASLLLAAPALAEVTKHSGEHSRGIWVECLNDHVQLDWTYDAIITTKETAETWMYTQSWRQSGNGMDSFGNQWSFRGHWSATDHGDPNAELYTEDFHLVSKDILIADSNNTFGFGNLIMSSVWRIKFVDGEREVFLKDNTVSCLPAHSD